VTGKDLKGLTGTGTETGKGKHERKTRTKRETRRGTETGIGMWRDGGGARMEIENEIMRRNEREIRTESTAKIELTARVGIMKCTTESQAGVETWRGKEKGITGMQCFSEGA
jgi:hypothetical protein